MKSLLPAYFFDLSQYVHRSIFDEQDFVWKAISALEKYFDCLTFDKSEASVSNNAYLINPDKIHLGRGTVVEPGAYIQGPCWIGENCTIRHGAYIRGFVLTGHHCVIGHDTEVIRSILLDHVHAAHFAYLGQTILGNHVNLGAGTKCANLKLDRKPISIRLDDKKIDTGLRKLGAIIGDHSQMGCNVVTNPGTLIGQNVLCYPSINFGGVVHSNHLVKSTNTTLTVKRGM